MNGYPRPKIHHNHQVIYRTWGKAEEFNKYAANLYIGACGNECRYCWVKLKGYVKPGTAPAPAYHILENLERDARDCQKQGWHDPVTLCFRCDAYQPIDRQLRITRQAITILHTYDIPVHILTKGGLDPLRDFDLLRAGDIFTPTLTFSNDKDSTSWEMLAGLPGDRIAALEEAHRAGIDTWVSLEPIIDVDQTLELIDLTHDHAGHYKASKLNYYKLDPEPDWKAVALKVIDRLDRHRARYYIKKDLAAYLGENNGINRL
jgi:DNA repair photolyase